MRKKSGAFICAGNSLLCLCIILSVVFFMDSWSIWVKATCCGLAFLGFVVGTAAYSLHKDSLLKGGFVLVVCAFLLIAAIALMSRFTDIGNYKTDADKIEKLTEMIRRTGRWGMLVYVLVQILQVVILPLPAAVCYIPGSQIWDVWTATLLASFGVLIGSVIAYFIGRVFGKKVVMWIAGREAIEKYASYIGSRGKVVFILMQILPFFPDDILCMVAGLMSMNFLFFFISIAAIRPLIVAAYCFLGSGTIIPFRGWGLVVWIFIFIGFAVLAVLSFRYQDKLEGWLVGKFSAHRKKVKGAGARCEKETAGFKGRTGNGR